MKKIAGLDIGGSKFRIALATNTGRIIRNTVAKTDPNTLMSEIYKTLDGFGKLDGIGIAWPGPVHARRGITMKPPNDIGNRNIVGLLKKRYRIPVYILNDCVAGALGEKVFGSGKNAENLVYITISTGIGCGVITNNRLFVGKDGNGHECGHLVADASSQIRCGCGGYGHWEALCSGKNMGNFASHLLNTKFKGQGTKLSGHKSSITAEMLFRMYSTDRVARKIVDIIEKINAMEIAAIVNAYDPELITIGGAVALKNPGKLMKAINLYTKRNALNRMPKIMITKLKGNACLYGAIASVLKNDWLMQ